MGSFRAGIPTTAHPSAGAPREWPCVQREWRRAPAFAVAAFLSLPLLLACAAGQAPPDDERADTGASFASRAASSAEPPAALRAAADRTTATIGDLIVHEVVVERDPEATVDLAEPIVEVEGFRLVDLGQDPPQTTASGRIVERRWFQFRADLVGAWALPAVSAAYSGPGGAAGELETPEIPVEVESVLPADDAEVTDIRDIKPLRRIDDGKPWLPWTGLAAAALAVLAAAWWWRRRRRQLGGDAPAAPPIPPWDLAMRDLERLRRADFSDLRELRRHHFAVSAVVRTYVEGRFGVNATDLTTEEILGRLGELVRLGGSVGLDKAQARRLERFLAATDQVKFAARLPLPEEIDRTFEQALGFVQATRPEETGDGPDGQGAAGPDADGPRADGAAPGEAGKAA